MTGRQGAITGRWDEGWLNRRAPERHSMFGRGGCRGGGPQPGGPQQQNRAPACSAPVQCAQCARAVGPPAPPHGRRPHPSPRPATFAPPGRRTPLPPLPWPPHIPPMLPLARALLAAVELDTVSAETVHAAQSAIFSAIDLRYAPHGGLMVGALARNCSKGGTYSGAGWP